MSSDPIQDAKFMPLRYAGQCRACGSKLTAGTRAIYFRSSKTIACLHCAPQHAPLETSAAPIQELGSLCSDDDSTASIDTSLDSESAAIFPGSAGASTQREYERRKTKRETRIREAHPHIGGFLLAMSDDPQSTKAWATGAAGEKTLGKQLDGLVNETTFVLHDRRIPPTKANIDHIVISSSGVFVIDAKKYLGRPSLRIEGGFLRPRVEKLMIGSRDNTKLVAGVQGQVGKVRAVLESAGLGEVSVSGMLCFVGADWPLIGGDFSTSGIKVLWPKKAVSHVLRPGIVDAETYARAHRALAQSFPPA